MLKDDPKVEYIIRATLDDPRMLSASMFKELQEEYDKAETFDDLSPFALQMYERTRDILAVDDSPVLIDDTYENANWLTPTPIRIGIKSKAGLEVYLKKRNMTMAEFQETPLYKMNKKEWDEMGVVLDHRSGV